MSTPPIEVDDFMAFFDRDFVYGEKKCEVREVDIEKAIAEANILFNIGLWDSVEISKIPFLYLTAHCLVKIFNTIGGVIQVGNGVNSVGSFPINSKGAGGLSVNYSIPEDLANDKMLSQFLTTAYGLKYLQLLVPNLVGNMGTAVESTKP